MLERGQLSLRWLSTLSFLTKDNEWVEFYPASVKLLS